MNEQGKLVEFQIYLHEQEPVRSVALSDDFTI